MVRPCATAFIVVALSVASVGCADNILKERPASRVAASNGVKPAFRATGSARGGSSVCAAYRRQLRVAQLTLLTESGKARAAELKAKELSLNAVIADACE
jgi:hypothetical protein